MATLAQLEDRARRRCNLDSGLHTITCLAQDPTVADTITIDDTVFTVHTTAQTAKAHIAHSATPATQATAIVTAIGNVFASKITASAVSDVVTITGARNISITQAATSFTLAQTSSEDEPPLTSDIDRWLLDAQDDIMNKLPTSMFIHNSTAGVENLVINETRDGNALSTQTDIPLTGATTHTIFKVLELAWKTANQGGVGDSIVLGEHVPYDLFEQIQSGEHPFFSNDIVDNSLPWKNKFWTIMNGDIKVSPATANDVNSYRMTYIRTPNATRTANCSLPSNLQNIMVTYAAARIYEQLGNYELAGAMKQEYFAELSTIVQGAMQFPKPKHEIDSEVIQ
jgi:hypothetical protein